MFSVECLNKTGNVRINVILRPVGVTVFARAKWLSITCPHCVSIALLIQHAKRVRRIVLSPVTYLAVHILLLYLINGTIFGKIFEYTMCILIFATILSENFHILRRNHPNIIINVPRSS